MPGLGKGRCQSPEVALRVLRAEGPLQLSSRGFGWAQGRASAAAKPARVFCSRRASEPPRLPQQARTALVGTGHGEGSWLRPARCRRRRRLGCPGCIFGGLGKATPSHRCPRPAALWISKEMYLYARGCINKNDGLVGWLPFLLEGGRWLLRMKSWIVGVSSPPRWTASTALLFFGVGGHSPQSCILVSQQSWALP